VVYFFSFFTICISQIPLIGLPFLKEIMLLLFIVPSRVKKHHSNHKTHKVIKYRKRLKFNVNFYTQVFLHFKTPQMLRISGNMERVIASFFCV